MVENKEDILEVLMKYNQVLLGRNQHLPEYEELAKLKRQISETLEKGEIEEFETLKEEEWEEIVEKIKKKGKSMFQDFIQSGEEWKNLWYHVIKRMYEEEQFPESFLVTELKPLYKKGDPRDPGNYRYLHLRNEGSRLLEFAIYQKLKLTFNEKTGSNQLGGMPQSSTIEHLIVMNSVINEHEKNNEGIVVTFCDVKKCFDSCHFSDMLLFLVKSSADVKAMKMLTKLTGRNVLHVQGSSRRFQIDNGIGQGGICAARLTSGGTTEAYETNLRRLPNPLIHQGVDVTCQEYVDDATLLADGSEGARTAGRVVTDTLTELALQAHSEKTVQVVVGSEEFVKRTRKELEE